MTFESQLLFFFSALGAFNGLFLSFYFAFLLKNKTRATYFLAALLFVVSFRVTKSVFLTFYPGTSSAFVQLGLLSCFLIGPFLYLYVSEVVRKKGSSKWKWLLHIVPIILIMIYVGVEYPYREFRYIWWRSSEISMGWFLCVQWLLYVVLSGYAIRGSFKKLLSKTEKISSIDFWLINVVIGIALVWLAYNTSYYTSYIVGALTFSFSFYLTLIIWFYRRRKNVILFFDRPEKYANRKIDLPNESLFQQQLETVVSKDNVFRNSNLKLIEVAAQLQVTPHYLSQYLNDNLGKSFSLFINEYRIEDAKIQLLRRPEYTTEAIGYECGFNSKSTFFTTFKKITGQTPSSYKKENS